MSESVKLEFPDVVTVLKDKSPLNASSFRVSEISAFLSKGIVNHRNEYIRGWDEAGIECEVLQVSGGGWRKGKVRISLEFIPEPEERVQEATLLPPATEKSPLDDLRTELLINE